MRKNERFRIQSGYNREEIISILQNFDSTGKIVADGERNKIKKFTVENGACKEINVKKFKKKSFFVKLIYKLQDGSKSERSYRYALKLIEMGIDTPLPVAYFDDLYIKEEKEKKSFYISENLSYDFTCREVFWNEKIEEKMEREIKNNFDDIVKGFAEYTFRLHENGVRFDDYSPGNVLIKKEGKNTYRYYLIDLNRMKFFNKLTFNVRMKNVSRMMEEKKFVEKFSMEYSKLYKEKSYEEIFEKLYYYVRLHNFKDRLHNIRRKIKKIFKRKK